MPETNLRSIAGRITFLLLACTLALVGFGSAAPRSPIYHLVKKVVLSGETDWDYFDVDSNSHRVFISRGKHMTVVDSDGKLVEDIPIAEGAHGIVFAPEFKREFTTSGSDHSMTILDLETLKVVGKVDLQGRNADFIIYDPASMRVFTFNPRTKDATAVDAKTGELAGHIALGGQLEAAQPDGKGHIYVNLQDKAQIVEFDSKALKVLNTWSIAPCEAPTGLAIDVAHKRLFAGCRDTEGIMVVLDYANGKVVATVPIGQGVDADRFDPETGLSFASCGDGTITVAHEDSPDKYTVVQTIATQKGARTMALDTRNHNVYTVTAEFVDKDYVG